MRHADSTNGSPGRLDPVRIRRLRKQSSDGNRSGPRRERWAQEPDPEPERAPEAAPCERCKGPITGPLGYDLLAWWSQDIFTMDAEALRVLLNYGLLALLYVLVGHGIAVRLSCV
jgi:hypothetical protein